MPEHYMIRGNVAQDAGSVNLRINASFRHGETLADRVTSDRVKSQL
jgi:hypothetical protein